MEHATTAQQSVQDTTTKLLADAQQRVEALEKDNNKDIATMTASLRNLSPTVSNEALNLFTQSLNLKHAENVALNPGPEGPCAHEWKNIECMPH